MAGFPKGNCKSVFHHDPLNRPRPQDKIAHGGSGAFERAAGNRHSAQLSISSTRLFLPSCICLG